MTVYLIESTKGLLSLSTLPFIDNCKNLFILLGPVSKLNIPECLSKQGIILRINRLGDSEYKKISTFLSSENSVENYVRVCLTDDTFNLMSFLLVRKFKKSISSIILYDHLRADNLSYRDYISMKNLWNYKFFFIKFPLKFRSIEFSNSALGYRVKMNFSNIIYFENFKQNFPQIKEDKKIIFLIPFTSFKNEINQKYLLFIDQLILRTKNADSGDRFLIKLHPRDTLYFELNKDKFREVEKCRSLDSNSPLEYYDLSTCLVVNLESSFENISNAKVLLLWKLFSDDNNFTSNLTGIEMKRKEDVEVEIINFMHGNY